MPYKARSNFFTQVSIKCPLALPVAGVCGTIAYIHRGRGDGSLIAHPLVGKFARGVRAGCVWCVCVCMFMCIGPCCKGSLDRARLTFDVLNNSRKCVVAEAIAAVDVQIDAAAQLLESGAAAVHRSTRMLAGLAGRGEFPGNAERDLHRLLARHCSLAVVPFLAPTWDAFCCVCECGKSPIPSHDVNTVFRFVELCLPCFVAGHIRRRAGCEHP
jgi:hypothetical protein